MQPRRLKVCWAERHRPRPWIPSSRIWMPARRTVPRNSWPLCTARISTTAIAPPRSEAPQLHHCWRRLSREWTHVAWLPNSPHSTRTNSRGKSPDHVTLQPRSHAPQMDQSDTCSYEFASSSSHSFETSLRAEADFHWDSEWDGVHCS